VDEFEPIRRFYDDEYYADLQAEGSLPWHCRRILRRLGGMAGKQVLDIGCGTGEWLAELHMLGARVSGVDLSRRAVEACIARLPDGEFHCGPAESLPFADGRFDLVLCMGSLEHFLDKRKALDEMRRVGRSDARYLILVPNAGFLTRRLKLYGGTHQVKAREDVLTLEAWAELFAGAGLHVMRTWRDLHPLSRHWIFRGNPLGWPLRAAQALALAFWPIRWQYQVYHYCQGSDA
jgi:SAM-dependent methyltransferase